MPLRISKIDYETKTVTLENAPDSAPTLPQTGATEPTWTASLSGIPLRLGMSIEGDGIDENGMFINPRRVK